MRKKILVAVVVLALAVIGGLVTLGIKLGSSHRMPIAFVEVNLDFNAPDVLVRSKGLSSLPADLLKVPLLNDLLSEDFLFYYEHSEGRLGLSGTVRRIAYEHDVSFTDELIKLVLDEPADVALWRGSKGEIKYYSIAMTRNTLAKLLEPVAKIAMDDRQLVRVGEASVEGEKVSLFSLEYASNRRLLLATHKDRVVVFSDPGMVLSAEGDVKLSAETVLADLLGSDIKNQQRFASNFGLAENINDHSIAVKANFLSFHYQYFFPALKALRFDFGRQSAQGWSTAMLLEIDPSSTANVMDGQVLWSSLPHQAGICIALPIDWDAVVATMNSKEVVGLPAEELSSLFGSPVGACWYAQSRLHAPLFVAQLTKTENSDAILGKYFNYGIKLDEGTGKQKEQEVKAITSASGDVLWQAAMNSDKSQAALARSGNLIYFSPDGMLVKQALAVAHKQQPAISDSWSDTKIAAKTVALIGPGQLAQLVEQEIALSLPRQQDALLRSATDQHLLPKLAAVKKYPPMRLEMHELPTGSGWVTLDWHAY